ncbi:DUF3006 domain-containing protein [Chakrabartyella piscis]|uniref:DUF3006 domain-containing protein n=1 Tax=Chakrabartyella piscis TaxID=2918914 RepID=UPI00295853C3|nr:DUF3006 domain-containing protein [Chakrabartyella piscis]
MKLTIDRLEGNFAVCELENKKMVDIPIGDLPNGIHDGMKLEQTDSEYVILDDSEDRKRIQEKMKRLFGK